MQSDFNRFKDQLIEIEQRSSITSMVSSYLNQPSFNDEDMLIFNNVSIYKQYFMLRK